MALYQNPEFQKEQRNSKFRVLLTPVVVFFCAKKYVSPIFLKLWILIEGHGT